MFLDSMSKGGIYPLRALGLVMALVAIAAIAGQIR
jgi:hypothetical protein